MPPPRPPGPLHLPAGRVCAYSSRPAAHAPLARTRVHNLRCVSLIPIRVGARVRYVFLARRPFFLRRSTPTVPCAAPLLPRERCNRTRDREGDGPPDGIYAHNNDNYITVAKSGEARRESGRNATKKERETRSACNVDFPSKNSISLLSLAPCACGFSPDPGQTPILPNYYPIITYPIRVASAPT